MLYSNWFNVEYVWFFTVSISWVIIFNYSISFNKLEAVLGCLTAAYFISPLVAYNWKVSGGIRIFCTKKISQEKSTKFIKVFELYQVFIMS